MAAIQALQQWCKQQCEGYKDVSITNMTTSFRDGLAFCAILHKHRPDLINFSSLSKENIYENNQLAFRVAEEELGIPALLDAEDMVALKVPDRLSILTYVSQYYNYFHGRSPIGGMSGIKRPPSQPSEEPIGKKVVPEPVAPMKPARSFLSSGPKADAAHHGQSLLKENAPVTARRVLGESENTRSSNCAVCGNHVHLVQRLLMDGKLYHRNCFRCHQCSNTLQSGKYKAGTKAGTFICNRHEQNSPPVNSRGITAQIKPADALSPKADIWKGHESGGFLSQGSPRMSPKLKSSSAFKEPSPQLTRPVSNISTSSISTSSKWPGLAGNKASPPGSSTTSPPLSHWTASSAKTQQAREKFFQSDSHPSGISADKREPPKNQGSGFNPPLGSGRTSFSGTLASGTGSDAREKDKARSFLANAIPGSPLSSNSLGTKSNTPFNMAASNTKTSSAVSPSQHPETRNILAGKIARPDSVPSATEETGRGPSFVTEQSSKEKHNRVGPEKAVQNKSKNLPPSRPANIENKLDVKIPKAGHANVVKGHEETPAEWRTRLKPVGTRDSKQADAKASHKPAESQKVTVDVTVSPAKSGKKAVTVPANQDPVSLANKAPKKKLLVPPLDISRGWQKTQQQWEDNPAKVEAQDPPKKVVAPVRPSPPRMFSKHLDNQVTSPIKLHPDYVPEEEIQKEVQKIEKDLDKLELKGIAMEKQLRNCEGDDTEDALMVEWFKLIHEKQLLLRQESELMHKLNQQKLEEKQWDIGSELRRLMSKPESQKTAKEKAREEELLNLYVATVNDRNKIVEDLDEDRIREQEEDEMLAAMIQRLDGRSHAQGSEKKKSKSGFFSILKSKS